MPSPEAIRVARIISRKTPPPSPFPSSHLPKNPTPQPTQKTPSHSTTAWSLSFYPQPVLNLRRRSTTGTTPAFPFINTLGFLSYFLSTLTFYASPLIRAQYAARNPTAPTPTVRLNDLVFTIHAVVMSTLTWTMAKTSESGARCGGLRRGVF
ncbi:MAG: hypothetical protein L6R36_000427 [Xanthoria steineri]|nr:MAG: hypothetical protein L6R36_000427 [Xanthoria steineri]